MSLVMLQKKVYLEELVKIFEFHELPLRFAINKIFQLSQEHHLPLNFTNKVMGVPLGTKFKADDANIKGEKLVIKEREQKIKTFSNEENKLIHSSKIYLDNDFSVLGVNLFEFKYKEEHFINILDGATEHEPLLLWLEDIFCERDDVIAFMNKKENLPSYLDVKSPHYAKELDIAIQQHKDIQVGEYGKGLSNTADKVSKWFNEKEHNLKVTDTTVKRFASIISIKK